MYCIIKYIPEHINCCKHVYGNGVKYFFLALIILITQPVSAQKEPVYDEVAITMNIQRIGNIDVQAIIKGQSVYLPVKQVFNFLKIKNTSSADLDSISGFIVTPATSYIITMQSDEIVFREKVYKIGSADIIKGDHDLYLKTDWFGQVFGLDCLFNFRSLSVAMKPKIELPAIIEMQQQQMRRNINSLKGERKADTLIRRKYPMFALGMADWSVNTLHEIGGLSNTRINLGLGAIVAGGEATAYLTYNSNAGFNSNQQFYRWRYVNNENRGFRQVSLGNVYTQTIATVDQNVTGIQITNAPTTYKKSFGTYTISNKTDPDWTVELYINNILVNYTKADASGFFTFEVPIVYGRSIVRLRHISPWGEERIVEENINIPYNFLPANQFEYMVTAGIIGNEEKSRFSRVNFNYGLNNRVTVGGGIEYHSSIVEKKLPFVNASMRLGSNIVVSGEHAYQIRSKGIVTYKLPSNMQLDLSYIKYDPSQTAIRTSYLDEKKAVLSLPIKFKKVSSFYRFSYSQAALFKSKLTNAEMLVSTMIKGINTSFTTSGVFTDNNKPYIFSNLSLSLRLPKGIRVSPQVQYEYRQSQVSMVKFEAEKNVFKNGFINIGYENFFLSKNQVIGLGFRYNFSAAQGLVSVRQSKYSTLINQNVRGSLVYNEKANRFAVSSQNNVGRGGLQLISFLDLNENGKKDKNEPKVPGLKFNINGGRIQRNKKDTSVTVSGLEAYNNYFVEINKNSFENIGWQISKSVLSVVIEANHLKEIEIPVTIVGEVSGMVYLSNGGNTKGLGRMMVNIYNSQSVLVAKTLTEADGYYSYIGLKPGVYTAKVDEAQMEKLKMMCLSKSTSFTIKSTFEGDVVTDINHMVTGK